ncbi:hypothetical protein HYH03_016234 [Edaphochlamys debaryana]|uniref:MIB/HERC2 domain-containing protein n=1 Tax=Edaphochlamys debaryana TaxID=47281 RepID=A0A835XMP6_9CHLO|nr:hypothetical protein HYH03_016234 [Edaphochlamys debaryana]|eukprot:KAG2485031.1 hypothetical protein HYH03_016234 [Edaphochlamys debaryana]
MSGSAEPCPRRRDALSTLASVACECKEAATEVPAIRGGDSEALERALKGLEEGLFAATGDAEAGPDLTQRLGAALAPWRELLQASQRVSSPTTVLLVSGPLLGRLRASLAEVGSALQELGTSLGVASPHGTALAESGTPLAALPLPGLEQRASQAAQLGSWLEEASRRLGGLEAPDTHADAWRTVRSALEREGVPEATLEHSEARTRIAQGLYDLRYAEPPLTPEEVQSAATLAACLLPPPPASGGASCSTANGPSAVPAARPSQSTVPVPVVPAAAPARAPPAAASSAPAAAPTVRPPGSSSLPVPVQFVCAKTLELMRDPVTTDLGTTYEREVIEDWLRNHDTDPESAIEEWLAANGLTYDSSEHGNGASPPAVKEQAGVGVRPSNAAAGGPRNAAASGSEQPVIRVLDYVIAAPQHWTAGNAAHGPLEPGKYGIVIWDDLTDFKPLKVRALHAPYDTWAYDRAALQRVPANAVPPEQRLEIPPQPPGSGVPVLPFTARTGLLVRRGYDWLKPHDRNGLEGETGMLMSPAARGTRWFVLWANGGEGTYSVGHDNKFELQHLQFAYPPSGGGQGGGGGGSGGAEVWGREAWHSFDGSHVVRRGDPVTAETAQARMPVTRGMTWQWGARDGEGMVGELVRPTEVEGNTGVRWEVRWADGSRHRNYRVGRRGVLDWADLEVAMYERNREAGEMLPWTPVELVQDYQSFSNARDGPLRPGTDCGLVLRYDRAALRPIPPSLAVDRHPEHLRLNRLGQVAFPGRPGRSGGHNGRPAERVYYCGAEGRRRCRCGLCGDSRCGPRGGCPCAPCVGLPERRAAEAVAAAAGAPAGARAGARAGVVHTGARAGQAGGKEASDGGPGLGKIIGAAAAVVLGFVVIRRVA